MDTHIIVITTYTTLPPKTRILQLKEVRAITDALNLAISIQGDPGGSATRALNTLLGRNKNTEQEA